jgi:hypothetical protein
MIVSLLLLFDNKNIIQEIPYIIHMQKQHGVHVLPNPIRTIYSDKDTWLGFPTVFVSCACSLCVYDRRTNRARTGEFGTKAYISSPSYDRLFGRTSQFKALELP